MSGLTAQKCGSTCTISSFVMCNCSASCWVLRFACGLDLTYLGMVVVSSFWSTPLSLRKAMKLSGNFSSVCCLALQAVSICCIFTLKSSF